MAMKIVAFRHAICDGLGSLAGAIERTGADYFYIDSYHEDISSFDALGPDLVIVLGGPPGVYQADLYPFIKEEIAILEQRLAAGLPVLGICLGAQMLARALGSEVYIGEAGPEIGWYPVTVNEAGQKTAVRHLDKVHTNMVHWHGDTFDLPEGALLLASSEKYRNQAFSWGKYALGLQCHPEFSAKTIQSALVAAAGAVASGKVDVQKIRTDTAAHIKTLEQQAEKFLLEWLEYLKKERNLA